MKKAIRNSFLTFALGAALLGAAGSAQSSLVEIKFATNPIVNQDTANTDWVNALAGLGITPGGISGNLYYESTTSGNGLSPMQTFDGAVVSLNFTVADWFSQSLTNIGAGGNSGDITVRDNDGNSDRIQVNVVCTPAIGVGTTCNTASRNFNYSFTDSANITWALDQFLLTLFENSAASDPISGTALPTADEWESGGFTATRIDLRFNPSNSNVATGNVFERGQITFLAVPEPGTLALLGLGLLTMTGLRRRTLNSR